MTVEPQLAAPVVSVVVPTKNEAGNIRTLLTRVGQALESVTLEVLFVDDSTDETPQIILSEMARAPFPVRLLARPPARRNGLSGAVVDGLAAARGQWVCVMDGDLQHPPEVLGQLLAEGERTGANIVVGSRRTNIYGPMGLSTFRSLTSLVLTILVRVLFIRSLNGVSDPLTGLFLVQREQIALERLRPEGFKILLEILVRCPGMRVTELKFDFATRHQGQSKANLREGARFFRHLLRLRLTAHQRRL